VSELNTDLLPESLRDIADVIGMAATLNLVKAYGGVRLWVPVKLTPDHALVHAIGLQAARKLVEYCALEELWIPKAAAALRAVRDQTIRERRADGEQVARLALEYGLTDRRVWEILAAGEEDEGRQAALW